MRQYGAWRSAQAGTGAAGALIGRYIIGFGVSLSALGNLELARLVTAPLLTALAGVGNVLLPVAARQRRAGESVSLGRASLLLLGGCLAYAAILLLGLDALVGVIASKAFSPGRISVSGWLLVAVTLAGSQSLTLRALVELKSRRVFVLRTVGTVAATAATAVLVASELPEWTPFALALGAAVTAGLLRRDLKNPSLVADIQLHAL